jgi:hypothetical protein
MQTLNKPMLKNKGGDLTDVTNYRAKHDMYQFGFKKVHSTGLCNGAVKKTIYYNINQTYYYYLQY